MTFYYRLGHIPPKRHTQFWQPEGSLYHEELMGMQGFQGIQSLLYHLRPPTPIQEILAGDPAAIRLAPTPLLHHCHLRTATVPEGGDAIASRVPLLANRDLCLSVARPTQAMDYWYRFAPGDELIFIHSGQGQLETQFGRLTYAAGDYLLIPAGVLWRWIPMPQVPQQMLVLQVWGHLDPPPRYRNDRGQFLEHSPYCERDLRPPEALETHDEAGSFEVRVLHGGDPTQLQMTRYRYAHHPLDVVGWDGYLWPYTFNIADFEPITGRIHQPPPVHQTFAGPGLVVCSFVPRLLDYHPQAIPAPYNHANVDSDEVLYYVSGTFLSRSGIESASLTLHPRGLPHGPHPGRYETSVGQDRTEEYAVMMDTAQPLQMTPQAIALEDPDYSYRWRGPEP
ncbi:homogentisate 1,2-dioxygenase [Lyngbya confervoides]|uniref:Homogentisate 1,2-dioxygenase n=1 Tax=Lyngbya confervoides BDU141951 TaxID=1574623 RepID=A0ABD4SZ11_9CYAN|nr:homogentisate 1,2-dioxygenase [Lyngbya confervoides]MCM1981722.1 homogentisate 1,2-dioxygenase [Lyngbya confervoides BDU141951]